MSFESNLGVDCVPAAEKEQVQTLVQQERLVAQGQMASGIAHDINNSLTPIIGYSDFLLDARSGLSDESKKCLQGIRTAAADIAHLVEQLRQFYRRREEAEVLKPVDLNALTREVLEATRPLWFDIPQKEDVAISIKTSLEARLDEIRGMDSDLREALTQVIRNSIEAMPQGGTITVTTRKLAQDPRRSSEPARVILEISDTGAGMDERTRQRCLEPFFSTKGQRGTGLGLAMVYGTMRRHGGTVEIESELGRGTTVRLRFPAPERASGSNGFTAAPRPTPMRILCVDDDYRISAMLQEVLTSDRHHVEVANGGEKGLTAFRKAMARGQPFHVVITDLGMPNVDGHQIVRAVKKESPETPVILLTGWAAVMDQDGELPHGVDAVLRKPPSMDRLHEVLAQVTLSKASAA